MNFPGRRIAWDGGHALKRCTERGKDPAKVEKAIQDTPYISLRADGRYELDACIDGEVTHILVVDLTDRVVPVTVYGRGVKCS
jgi:hypothetical protein